MRLQSQTLTERCISSPSNKNNNLYIKLFFLLFNKMPETNYYDEIASGYDELHELEQKQKIEVIKAAIYDLIKFDKNMKLLDVGCGTGISTECWDCKCWGIDPSLQLIQIADEKRKKLNIQYQQAAAEDIPFKDDTFNIVVSLTAIQNFGDIEKALSEIKRVAKKDALLILSVLKKAQKIENIKEAILDRFELRKMLIENKDIIFIAKNKK